MIFSSVDGLTAVDNRKHVLVDGCFDPLHQGHIRYLRTAARVFHGKSLAVVVATDDEIRKKGREPLLSQSARCAVVDGLAGVDVVIAQDRPTHELISALKPLVYAKGSDWEGKLPPEILAACSLNNTQVLYLDTVLDSSSDRLRQWALRDADASLDRLEAFMAAQTTASKPWQPVTDYSFEARKAIEGRHPELIAEAFPGMRVLDAGCGPGGILVRLLRDIGVNANGFDKNPPTGNGFFAASVSTEWFEPDDAYAYQVAICREVLEHLTVAQVNRAVANLFRWASRFVYITTRFSNKGVFEAETDFETDPTHVTCLSQPFLRSLCVLNGGKRRKDLESKLDHMNKGRVLVYEVAN